MAKRELDELKLIAIAERLARNESYRSIARQEKIGVARIKGLLADPAFAKRVESKRGQKKEKLVTAIEKTEDQQISQITQEWVDLRAAILRACSNDIAFATKLRNLAAEGLEHLDASDLDAREVTGMGVEAAKMAAAALERWAKATAIKEMLETVLGDAQ